MKNNHTCIGMSICLALALLSSPVAGADAAPATGKVRAEIQGATGLVLDNRGNAYTIEPSTGRIICLPPGGDAVEFVSIDGTPTTLAMDRERTLFIGTRSGAVYAVSPDGTDSLVHHCGRAISGISLDRDGNLLLATDDGAIIRVSRTDFHTSSRRDR